MALTFSGKLQVISRWTLQNELDLSTPEDKQQYTITKEQTNGTGDDQCQDTWHDQRSVSATTTTDDIDLTSLTNSLGLSRSFATVREVIIQNLSTTSGAKIKVGGAASNAWAAPFDGSTTAKVTIGPEGFHVWSNPNDGYAVSGSSKNLRITFDGASGTINYRIIVKGT